MESITIHGREGYSALIKSIVEGVPVDLSAAIVYFEVPDAGLRLRLPVDPEEATALRLTLSRADVERIPSKASLFAIVDETGLPKVIKSGLISRNGYKGEPK